MELIAVFSSSQQNNCLLCDKLLDSTKFCKEISVTQNREIIRKYFVFAKFSPAKKLWIQK